MVEPATLPFSRSSLEKSFQDDLARPDPRVQTLIRISSRYYYDYPPGAPLQFHVNAEPGDPDLFALPLILTGEAGSGVSTVEEWLNLKFCTSWPARPVLRFSLSRWMAYISGGPDRLVESPRGPAGSAGFATKLRGVVERGRGERRPDALLDLFQESAEHNEELLVFLYDLADYPHADTLLSGLRRLWDWYRLQSLKLVLSVPDPRILAEGLFSEIGSASDMYRPPFFGKSEIDGLRRMHAPGLPESEVDSEEFLAWTGGQPLLCRLLIRRMGEYPNLSLSEHAEWVFRHRPQKVDRWQKALAEIVSNNPFLQDLMRTLLSGQAVPIGQIGRETLPLFAQGWLRFDSRYPNTLCRIRSRFHRHWGKEPLQNPSAFLERS